MAKIYTRTGDQGTTGLADGTRLDKDHLRIEAYGTIDELNSCIGICCDHLASGQSLLHPWLEAIQNDLFNLGSDLATPVESRWEKIILVDDNDVRQLELMIDALQNQLPVLRHFILPGGSSIVSYFHLARTICRRAERRMVSLQKHVEINQKAIKYINRLSDLLFVMARWTQHDQHSPEIKWDSQKGVRFLPLSNK